MNLASHLSRAFPDGHADGSPMSIAEVAGRFRELGILNQAQESDDAQLHAALQAARASFGNTTDYAEFNIFCDPEAASAIFSDRALAEKTTLIPLDVTHQVLANVDVQKMLSNGSAGNGRLSASPLRHLFLEILTFFAHTYEREFGMSEGPPLHDPIAVAAAFAPTLFDDNEGERFEVFVVKSGDEKAFIHERTTRDVKQCGRTIAKMRPKGQPGVRIPRSLDVPVLWQMIELALSAADEVSPMSF